MSDDPCVLVESLRKSFPTGDSRLEVLKGLDLTLHWGEFTVVTGSSGSGKSTLLHILGGLDRIDSGRVSCCGISIGSMTEKQLSYFRRDYIGFIFQNHYLIDDLTVRENLVLPGLMNSRDKLEVEQTADSLIERVGLSERSGHFPQQLSGGERQRVAIARAFMNNPRIVLADEPTGNLDEENTTIVMEMLMEIIGEKGKTLVLVTHDQELAKTGETVYKLKEGVLQTL